MHYDIQKAIAYAHKWALARNPRYYNFDIVKVETNVLESRKYLKHTKISTP